MSEKLCSFGWEAVDVDGHDSAALVDAVQNRTGDRPLFLTCRTVKGKGVSYMIDALSGIIVHRISKNTSKHWLSWKTSKV